MPNTSEPSQRLVGPRWLAVVLGVIWLALVSAAPAGPGAGLPDCGMFSAFSGCTSWPMFTQANGVNGNFLQDVVSQSRSL